MQKPHRQPAPERAALPGHHETRAMLGSLIIEPTAFIDLSADFIAKLRAVAPQPTRPRLRYAVAMIALMALAFLAVTSAHRTSLAMHRTTPVPSAPISAPSSAPPQQPSLTSASTPAPEPSAQSAAASEAPPATIELAANEAAPSASDDGLASSAHTSAKKHSRTPRKPHRRMHR